MSADLPPFEHAAQMKFTQVPNPEWTFGQGIDATPEGRAWMEGEKEGWKVVDASREDPTYVVLSLGRFVCLIVVLRTGRL